MWSGRRGEQSALQDPQEELNPKSFEGAVGVNQRIGRDPGRQGTA